MGDSYDSDDSDIGKMLESAEQRSAQNRPAVDSPGVAEDSDDEEEQHVVYYNASKKRKDMTIEEKLASMEHNAAIRERQRGSKFRRRAEERDPLESSSSDEEGEDVGQKPAAKPAPVVQAVSPPVASHQVIPPQSHPNSNRRMTRSQRAGAPGQAPPQPVVPPPHATASAGATIDLLDSSDDEEYNRASTEPASEETILLTKAIQEARKSRKLLECSQRNVVDVDDEDVVLMQTQILTLTIHAKIDFNGEVTEKDASITVSSEDTLAMLEKSMLKELELEQYENTICALRTGSRSLSRMTLTVTDAGLSISEALFATIHVTSWKHKRKKQAAASNFGPLLQLVLRQGGEKRTVSHGLRQPFRDLMKGGIKIIFDGEALSPDSTPEHHGRWG
jgi:hypothetical protein